MRLLLIIPTHNEELVIEKNLREVFARGESLLQNYDWSVLVADNGSTDKTGKIVTSLQSTFPKLSLWQTDVPGRGNALRTVWQKFDADIYAYMDADLATDLNELPKLLHELEEHDIAIGSRLLKSADVKRSMLREFVSRIYLFLSHAIVPVRAKDLQCGFKAAKKEALYTILPHTSHNGWFFDSELVVLAEHLGYKVKEIPVSWNESPDERRKTTVNITSTAWDNIVHLFKLRRRLKKLSRERS